MCSFVTGLYHTEWYFLVPFFFLWISYSCFNRWVLVYCVNVQRFLYLFLVEGNLDSLQLLAIIKKDSKNTLVPVSRLYVGSSFGYMPRSHIAISSGYNMSNFSKETPDWYPECMYQLLITSTMEECSFFFTFFPASAVTRDFDLSHSNLDEVESQGIYAFPW